MTINAIVFDMDDTLYEEKDYAISGFKVIDKWIKEVFQITGFYELSIDLLHSGEKKFIFNKALEKLKINYDELLITEMVERYRSHKPEIQLLDDAKWILENLRENIKIGLISDGYLVAQEKKVKALKLEDKFDSIVLTDRFGKECWKPSPIPYEQASRELQIPHHQCVYIGDNVKKDFITAKKLGWTTVHINRKSGVYANIHAEQEYHAHYQTVDLRRIVDIPPLKHLFRSSEKSA